MSVDEWKRPFPELLWCYPDFSSAGELSFHYKESRKKAHYSVFCMFFGGVLVSFGSHICWVLELSGSVWLCPHYVPTSAWEQTVLSLPGLWIWAMYPSSGVRMATRTCLSSLEPIHTCSCGWPRCFLLPADWDWQRETLELRYSFSSLTAPLHFCLAFLLYPAPTQGIVKPCGMWLVFKEMRKGGATQSATEGKDPSSWWVAL